MPSYEAKRYAGAARERMQAVAFFGVRDFVDAAAVGIIRSRAPEPGNDPRDLLRTMGTGLAVFERRLIVHMGLEHMAKPPSDEYAYDGCFHGTVARALEVLEAFMRQVPSIVIAGNGDGGYDLKAVFQNAGVRLREIAHTQTGPVRCERCAQCSGCFEDQALRSASMPPQAP